jgi:hypothetical protein
MTGAERKLEIGSIQPDGTIFAGFLPDGRKFYAMPSDMPKTKTWLRADAEAKACDAHGHKDWQLPEKLWLLILYQHKDLGAFKGNLKDKYGSGSAHWYWSCTERRDVASRVYAVAFTDGDDDWALKDVNSLSSRLVRVEYPGERNE